jgi:hypothetical protein
MLSLMSHSNASIGLLSPDEIGMVYGGGSETDTCGTSDAASQPCQPYYIHTGFVFETQNPSAGCATDTDKSGITIKEEDTVDTSANKKGQDADSDCTREVSYTRTAHGPGWIEYNGSCVEDEGTKYCIECTNPSGTWEKEGNFFCIDP